MTVINDALQGIGGQVQLSSPLGRLLQKLAEAINQQASHPPQSVPGTYGQTAMSSAGAGQLLGPGTDVVFDSPGEGDIPYDNTNGIFTLAPLTAYRLTAHFSLGTYSGETINVVIEWVDADSNAPISDDHGTLLTPGTNTLSINAQETADVIMPAAGVVRRVKCRVTAAAGTATALPGACNAIVQAL